MIVREPAVSVHWLTRITWWATFTLAVVALGLGLIWLRIIIAEEGDWSLTLLAPLLMAATPWIFLDILTRDHHPGRQRPVIWLLIVLIIGAVALLQRFGSFTVALLAGFGGAFMPFGPGAFVFVHLPFLIGCLSYVAVCRITWQTFVNGRKRDMI